MCENKNKKKVIIKKDGRTFFEFCLITRPGEIERETCKTLILFVLATPRRSWLQNKTKRLYETKGTLMIFLSPAETIRLFGDVHGKGESAEKPG